MKGENAPTQTHVAKISIIIVCRKQYWFEFLNLNQLTRAGVPFCGKKNEKSDKK